MTQKYYINYQEDGKITGFVGTILETNNTVEVSKHVWDYAQSYNTIVFDGDDIDFTYVDYPDAELLLILEYTWAKDELSLADVQVNKHIDGDPSKTSTKSKWCKYRIALRAYASFSNGEYTTNGDRPTAPK